ncbi:ATP-binding protein [Aquipseudomonas campi]
MDKGRPKKNFKEFTVDAALLRELGERLVGKPHVALSELVKNSYDADATEVEILFGEDSITVSDNGTGMSQSDFVNHWLRVGTIHKQTNTTTPRGRTVTGSKGIGRLSVQFLGEQLELVSKKKGESQFEAVVDWPENIDAGDLISAGAYVFPTNSREPVHGKFATGTSVTIRGLKQQWGKSELRDLARELWFLQPPEILLKSLNRKDKFQIAIKGVADDEERSFSDQMHQAFENWIAVIEGELKDGSKGGGSKVKVTFKNGDEYNASYKENTPLLDSARFKIYVFKLSGKQTGGVEVTTARKYFRRYGGVHVYDNNFRLPFYGGEEQDWLGLEYDHSHRLNRSVLLPPEFQVPSGLNDLPTNGRIFGLVQISTSNERKVAAQAQLRRGNYLNVQVTRDRLIDNHAFQQLVNTVRWALDFYAMRSFERRQKEKLSKRLEIPETETKSTEIQEQLFKISLSAPAQVAKQIEKVSENLRELKELEDQRKSAINAERVLLAALATTGMAALAMEHELQKELVVLYGIKDQLKSKRGALSEAKIIEALDNWAERTTRARKLFSPLMNEYDREKRNKYKAKKVIDQIVKNSEAVMRDVSVEVDIPSDLQLPEATFAGWNAIFQNVLINAVNAMIDSKVRRIHCSSEFDDGEHTIYVQDTGVGVRLHDSSDLFKPFVRRLEIPEERKSLGLGGMGIGLTIVKMVADSLDCEVSFVEPAPSFKTAFKISWSDQ